MSYNSKLEQDANPKLSGTLDTNGKSIKESKGADVASATALTLGTDGNYFDITGTTTITSIGSLGIGTRVTLHFNGILTLTHHATDLILPGGSNITTAPGDEFTFFEYSTGDWRCTSYSLASGEAIVSGTAAGTGTVQMRNGDSVSAGGALSGLVVVGNELVFRVTGSGAAHDKILYHEFVVPDDYSSGGTFKLDTLRTTAITSFTISAFINNVVDSTVNGVSVSPSTTSTFEPQTATLGTSVVAGDRITLHVVFDVGGNGNICETRSIRWVYNN